MLRIGFPGEALGIEAYEYAGAGGDPGTVAIGESSLVVRFSPDEKTIGGVLNGISGSWIVLLVVEAAPDDGRDVFSESSKA